MFNPDDILYEDNHLLIVNKRCGDLVQPDPSGESALEDQIKAFIKWPHPAEGLQEYQGQGVQRHRPAVHRSRWPQQVFAGI